MKREDFVDCVGVELEGGWWSVPEGEHVKTDTTVDAAGDYVGEIVSSPYLVTTLKGNCGLFDWMKACYPEEIDETCGLHVHLSLQGQGDYGRLCDRLFYDRFVVDLGREFADCLSGVDDRDWYMHRIRHGTDYARIGYRDLFEDRYRFINSSALGRHGTLEFRPFPMPHSALSACRLVDCLVGYVCGYLSTPDVEVIEKLVRVYSTEVV